jgi:hypothetical protein
MEILAKLVKKRESSVSLAKRSQYTFGSQDVSLLPYNKVLRA